jgi:hypothetical protein
MLLSKCQVLEKSADERTIDFVKPESVVGDDEEEVRKQLG